MLRAQPDAVSVVIVTFDTDPDLLERCISSVLANTSEPDSDVELIVVDNSPHDGLRARFAPATDAWVSGHGNIGFGRAANIGSERARGAWVLLLNPDAEIQAGGLKALLRAAKSPIRESALFCGWLRKPGGVQVDAYMHWWTSIGRLLRRRSYRAYLNRHASAETVPVQKVSGGALFAKRSTLLRFGPFDPRFFLYGEDADLSVRARRQGVHLFAVPAAIVLHQAASSQGSYSSLVEKARMDATIRISRYHLWFPLSTLIEADLFLVTIAGLFLGRSGSSGSLAARRDRLSTISSWGIHREKPPFRP